MKKTLIKSIQLIAISSVILLAGCSANSSSEQTTASSNGDNTIKVKVAYELSGKPMTYQDENGNAAGYDIDVMKLVDEKLENYEFEYIGTTSDDLLIGVEQGKFQVGVKNAFYTEERTKKYIYPQQFIGLSSAGLVLNKDNSDIKSLADFANKQFTLAPIAANNAQYTVIDSYNKQHPEQPIQLEAGDTFGVDVVQWVNEGRVDGGVMIEGSFNKQVTEADGPYHHLKDNVIFQEFDVIKTWPLFNKKEQQFADDYDQAMEVIFQSGELQKISEKHYGRDLFAVLDRVQQ
ncbi:transporter substrate-binding domain-containing protein [Paenibacillus yanchengensis]|uniref:Transporter substrate-binding domain-containing protein n=1 Tax=Paenibacillus yanchengensis TaxID=2035833 RepID=A0ABW4YKB7_9BACL